MLPNDAEHRLSVFLNSQPPNVVYMLTAVMYLGRGDFPVSKLRERYTEVSETFGAPKWAARLMLDTFLLPDYLQQGLEKLNRARVDVDHMLKGPDRTRRRD
jgi:hypothetical protein